jgi:hypothetical protein
MIPFGYFDLLETLPQPGCAICNLLQRDVHRLIDGLLWEHPNDHYILEKMRASRGLCNEHGWQFITMAYALNVAIYYQPVLDELLKILNETVTAPKSKNVVRHWLARSGSSGLAGALDPAQPCLVCDFQDERESRYVGVVAEYIADEDFSSVYEKSDGLCLPHFKMVICRTAHAERYICIQKDIWTRLQADLKTLRYKLAALVPNDQFGAEADSWRRAHALFTGGKGVFGRRR